MDSVAGPTVADTGIMYLGGSDTVRVGGLSITHPMLVDHYDTGTNITVPPSWPTSAVVQLREDGTAGGATFGLAVFAQTTLVTDDEARTRLVDDGFRVAGHEDSEVVRESELKNPESVCGTRPDGL